MAGGSKLVSRLAQAPKIQKGISYFRKARTTLAARSSLLWAWINSVMGMISVSTQLDFTRVRVKEQSGRRISREFRQEASEQLAKHSDDVARGLEETSKGSKKPEYLKLSLE